MARGSEWGSRACELDRPATSARKKGTRLTNGVWRNQKPLPSILGEGVGCEELLQVEKVEGQEGRERKRDLNLWSAERVG